MFAIKKILVSTDFSENASTAYPPARQLAEKYGATVDFIHIIPRKKYFSERIAKLGVPLNSGQDLYSKLQDNASGQLQQLMDHHITPENKGTCYVGVAAKPSKAIADKAMSGGYDLVVMAAKGGHATDFWAGSTTKRAIRYSKIPVFSTEKPSINGLQNILVPTDGTQESLQALPMAISLAIAFQARITMYNVMLLRWPLLEGASDEYLEPTYQKIREEVFNEMKTFFSESWDRVRLQKNKEREPQLIYKQNDSEVTIAIKTIVEKKISKYDAITEYARQEADIMIMATHGRQGLSRFMFGSVAEEVAHELKLPVITVQADVSDLV